MRIGFYQFSPLHKDRRRNLERIAMALEHTRADLVVLPEMCTEGYLFVAREELARHAEPVPDGPSCRTLVPLCRKLNLNLVFGLAELAGKRIYNSAVLITAAGEVHVYRKTHLFLDEKDVFDKGDIPYPVFDLGGVKVGMLVCFDHFFPEAARQLALKGAQVICHPANLVLDYAHTTTASRAIENRVFWILANRTGAELAPGKELRFIGRSQVVAPGGRVLYRAGAETEELPVIEIDPRDALDKMVTHCNHLLDDRRTDLY
jgi:5-aminopentanamidase